MKLSSTAPKITKKYKIEVPTNQYYSVPSLYKVYFGKHYLIWKGKSLLQSCEFLSDSIDRYIRLKKNDETDYLYHVCNHIKRTRCLSATVEVLANDFVESGKNGGDVINGYSILVAEQTELDKCAKDPLCLNNNEIAYIPNWVSQSHKDKFDKFLTKKGYK